MPQRKQLNMAIVLIPSNIPNISFESQTISYHNRTTPLNSIFIGNPLLEFLGLKIDINYIGYNLFIKSIYIEQNTDMMDVIELEFININRTNDVLFSSGQIIDIIIGYEESEDPTKTFNNFTITNIEYEYTSGLSIIKLICLGQGWKLAQHEKQARYINKTHSDIAHEIAEFHNLEHINTIDSVPTNYEETFQSNISDYVLLHKLAKLNGFLFYIENGVLHFHQIKSSISELYNNNLILLFNENEEGPIQNISISIDSYGKTINPQRQFVDRFTGEVHTILPEESKFVDGRLTIEDTVDQIKISKIGHEKNIYTNQFTLGESLEEVKTFLSSQKHFSDFTIKMKIRMVGHEQVQSRRLIKINGLDRFDGEYFITKVVHLIENDINTRKNLIYTTEIECYKKFIGITDPYNSIDIDFTDTILNSTVLVDVTGNSVIGNTVQLF